MSLINDVLRDLEARRSDDLKRQNLQGEIRPLPEVARRAPRWWIFAPMMAILIVAGAVAWWYGDELTDTPATAKMGLPTTAIQPPPVDMAPPLIPQGTGEKYELRPALSLSALPPMEAPVVPTPMPPPTVSAPASAPASTPAVATLAVAPTTTLPAPMAAAKAPSATVAKPAIATETTKVLPPALEKAKAAVAEPVKGSIEMKAVLATPRDRADAEYRSAQGLISAGRGVEAIESLRLALKHDPAYIAVRQALVRQLLEQRRNDEAMVALTEGLELQPGQIGWAMSLARLQVERSDLGAAQRTLSRSAPHAGGSADYAGFYGNVQYRLGHHRDAVALYQAATQLAAGEGRWWFGLGAALEADGRVGDAKEALRRALATGTLNADLSALAEQKLR